MIRAPRRVAVLAGLLRRAAALRMPLRFETRLRWWHSAHKRAGHAPVGPNALALPISRAQAPGATAAGPTRPTLRALRQQASVCGLGYVLHIVGPAEGAARRATLAPIRRQNPPVWRLAEDERAPASGREIALWLRPGDGLERHALAHLAQASLNDPAPRIVYGDGGSGDPRRPQLYFRGPPDPDALARAEGCGPYPAIDIRLRPVVEGPPDRACLVRLIAALPGTAVMHLPRLLSHAVPPPLSEPESAARAQTAALQAGGAPAGTWAAPLPQPGLFRLNHPVWHYLLWLRHHQWLP